MVFKLKWCWSANLPRPVASESSNIAERSQLPQGLEIDDARCIQRKVGMESGFNSKANKIKLVSEGIWTNLTLQSTAFIQQLEYGKTSVMRNLDVLFIS